MFFGDILLVWIMCCVCCWLVVLIFILFVWCGRRLWLRCWCVLILLNLCFIVMCWISVWFVLLISLMLLCCSVWLVLMFELVFRVRFVLFLGCYILFGCGSCVVFVGIVCGMLDSLLVGRVCWYCVLCVGVGGGVYGWFGFCVISLFGIFLLYCWIVGCVGLLWLVCCLGILVGRFFCVGCCCSRMVLYFVL